MCPAIAQNVYRMQLVEALHDKAYLRLRLSYGDARFQPGDGIEVGVCAVRCLLRCERERDPDISVVNACVAIGQFARGGVLNIARHHPDDAVRVSIECDRAREYIGSVVELRMPKGLADDGHVIVSWLVVFSIDGATELRDQLQRGEEPLVNLSGR